MAESTGGAPDCYIAPRMNTTAAATPLDPQPGPAATPEGSGAAPLPLAPIATAQRIQALDVVRGFALLGIFLMNVEFFNRTLSSMSQGMPRGLEGADWWASWFVSYFVQGKFWTIFSLLFGMGFAVMMVRAEHAGRDFKGLYLRRVLALAVFGAAHFIFLWEGDILLTYAVAALMLMLTLQARARPVLIAAAVLAGLGFIPGAKDLFAVAGGLAGAMLVALYLRNERRVRLRGRAVPVFALVLLVLGVLLSLAAVVFWLLPDAPEEARLPLSVFGPMVLLAGALAWKYHDPVELRALRLGAGLYLFGALAMTAGGVLQYFAPDPDALPAAAVASAAPAPAAVASAGPVSAASDAGGSAKVEKSREERAAERRAERKVEREKRLAEGKAEREAELQAMSRGRYGDAVDLRARRFPEKLAGDFGAALLPMSLFLLGIGFMRAGVMERTAEHLPLFRRLALWGLPLGIGLGLLGSLIAMSHTPGDRGDGWGMAMGLSFLGNLPACLGYVGLVVVMLHSKTALARIDVLAPLGRMALTNYLLQSALCAFVFYGHGLGLWGLPRAQQPLFVIVVFGLQVALSHWWLARFRYGPMEWLWRGFTYRQTPPFRL